MPIRRPHIRHQCEQSLINLERDYIDVYYFHHGDFGKDARYLPEAAATMDALVKEGKVRIKGQSAYSADDFERAVPVVKPAVLQSWAHALDDQFVRPGSRVSKLMDQYDMTYVAFSPLAQGRLLDKFDPKNPPQFEPGDHRKGSKAFSSEEIDKLKPKLEKTQGPLWKHDRRPGRHGAELHPRDAARRLRDSRFPQRSAGEVQYRPFGKCDERRGREVRSGHARIQIAKR